jgi:hypothetical protein
MRCPTKVTTSDNANLRQRHGAQPIAKCDVFLLTSEALRQRGVVVLAVDRQYRMEKFAPTVPQLGEHDHCLDRLTRQALRTVDQEQKCPLMALTLSDRLAEDLDPGGKVLPPGPVLFGNFQASAQQVHKPRRQQLAMARDR